MSLLSNVGILRHYALGSIVLEPFNEKMLANCSADLTLGDEIARYKPSKIPFDLASENPREMFETERAQESGCFVGRGFLIAPGERVLAHSREIAGGRVAQDGDHEVAVNSQLHATSTAARIGIQVCGCAGYGDIGFVSKWVFEVTNLSPRTFWLPVGAVIAQVSFHEVEPPLGGTTYDKIGSYQKDQTDPLEINKTWSLSKVLPKMMKVRG